MGTSLKGIKYNPSEKSVVTAGMSRQNGRGPLKHNPIQNAYAKKEARRRLLLRDVLFPSSITANHCSESKQLLL